MADNVKVTEESLKRFERLMLMGFGDDEAFKASLNYDNVELCVEHLTKENKDDEKECIETEEIQSSAYNVKSVIGSLFQMVYPFYYQNIGSDDEKKDDHHMIDMNNDGVETDILCKCGAKMRLKDTSTCYNGTNYLFVICDKCNVKCSENTKVFSCPKFQIDQHPEGYDICAKCAFHSKLIEPKKEEKTEKNDKTKSNIISIESEPKPQKIIRRALIIQTLSDKGNYECKDADALSNVFNNLGYQVIIISPNMVSKQSINNALDKLYGSPQEDGVQTFTVICYSGHGDQNDDGSFYFALETNERYSSDELYAKLNHNWFGCIKDGFVRMIGGYNKQNETLLIINACHSGALQHPLSNLKKKKKEVSKWKTKLIVLGLFAAIVGVCYWIRNYDSRNGIIDKGQELVAQIIPDETTEKVPTTTSTQINAPEMNENGMDYADDLMERADDAAVDFDWKDLKNDIKNRWKSWLNKRKGNKQEFVEHITTELLDKASVNDVPSNNASNASFETAETVDVSTEIPIENDNVSTYSMGINESMVDPSSRETWATLGRNFKECGANQIRSALLSSPAFLALCSGSIMMKKLMKSTNVKGVKLLASCKENEESSFYGKVSPFVAFVIDAISDNENAHAHKLDIKTLSESVSYDASYKMLPGGITLNGLGSHPVTTITTSQI